MKNNKTTLSITNTKRYGMNAVHLKYDIYVKKSYFDNITEDSTNVHALLYVILDTVRKDTLKYLYEKETKL